MSGVLRAPFSFDPEKSQANREKHGFGLDEFTGFDSGTERIFADDRFDYGEERFRAFGRIDGQGYMAAFARRGDTIRLISFRRAHEREMRRHDDA